MGVVLCRDGGAVVVEEGRTGAGYVADVVVVLDALASHGRCAVGQFGAEVGGLGEGVDIRVPGSEFVGSLLHDDVSQDNVRKCRKRLTNSYWVPLSMGIHSPSKVFTPLAVMMGKGTAWFVKLEEETTLERVLLTIPSVLRSSLLVLRSWYESSLP